jgi:hypothetical protein
MNNHTYRLAVTTQGPTYPPSEVLNSHGNFVVIGMINAANDKGECHQKWGGAVVAANTPLPPFGKNAPYHIIKEFNWEVIQPVDDCILYTLPLPLPCNNYPMVFAPTQNPSCQVRSSYPLHEALIPDLRPEDGRKVTDPIKLSDWVRAKGEMEVSLTQDAKAAKFDFELKHLIPNSLYTIMALRKFDLDPVNGPSRPGPLGVPNVFITDEVGDARYTALMPNPFSVQEKANRIVNVVVLWMSTQMSYGGAIGHYGLGGDIHAQLKLPGKFFSEFITYP